ncbi:MAG TPA: hypothetical protein VMM92_15405 [Thermoanaerobaculia bacterium]|nr:hypothetical protein [Thermoanaerobaculia bacterium]
MKVGKHLLVAIVVTSLTASAVLAQTAQPAKPAANESCSCTASACGNNAIGGAQGDIFVQITPANVKKYFVTNPNTGWTCTVPSRTLGEGGPLGCFCAGYCGNGGVGADPKTFSLGLNQDTIKKQYGGGAPGNPTGWLCGNYRGVFNPETAKILRALR